MAIPGYRILRKIRRGGMSTVYLAVQKSVDREVAIKVMSPSLASDPSFGSRFNREAKIVGQLSHPNIVSIYDVGRYKQYNYMAMDYLPGAPLQDKLEAGVSPEEALRIVREMASALDFAHERGYIHRDIKPDNILFREDGSAVLCDFGIAKALKGMVKMTNVGSVLGTPHYMSPEQAQGKELDGRADLYSLGVVFYEMLAGQVPFTGDEPVAVAVKHMSSPIPKLPAEHKVFQPIIEKMMAKKPSDRFQKGKDIIAALDELQESRSKPGMSSLTQTGSTTVEVISLIGTLLASLTTAFSLAFKRLMLTKITFKSSTVQLSNQQLEDIDDFILSGEINDSEYADLAIIQDTIEQPALRYPYRNIYILLGVLAVVGIGVLAFKYWPAETNQQQAEAVASLNSSEPQPKTVDADTLVDTTSADAVASQDPQPEEEAVAEPEPEPKPVQPVDYALTISTEPANARIRILNIRPKYRDGIRLQPGSYHIDVRAKDYFGQRKWIRIKNANVKEHIQLKPTRRLLAAGSSVQDTLKDGSPGPLLTVIPQGLLETKSGKTLQLSKAVALSIHEITFDDYALFVKATDRAMPDDFGWGKEQRPVIGVSYQDAQAYANWLSEQTGEHYRLPTLEEWQYAAHGGKIEKFWWPATKTASKLANCRRGCDSRYSKLFGSTTAPVGSYSANPYGLHDTAGNVEEWLTGCGGWQSQRKELCVSASVAGGSHADKSKDISSESLRVVNATSGSKTIGFRLLLEL